MNRFSFLFASCKSYNERRASSGKWQRWNTFTSHVFIKYLRLTREKRSTEPKTWLRNLDFVLCVFLEKNRLSRQHKIGGKDTITQIKCFTGDSKQRRRYKIRRRSEEVLSILNSAGSSRLSNYWHLQVCPGLQYLRPEQMHTMPETISKLLKDFLIVVLGNVSRLRQQWARHDLNEPRSTRPE